MVRMGLTVGVLIGVTMALLGCSGSRELPRGTGLGTPGVPVQGPGGSAAPARGYAIPPDAAPTADAGDPEAPEPESDAGLAGDAPGGTPAGCLASGALAAHAGEVALAAYSPDGHFIATLGDRELKVWDAAARRLLWSQPLDFGGLANAQSATFTPDSSRILVTGAPPRFLAVADGQPDGTVLMGGRADAVAISRDGTLVAGGCQCSGGAGARLWQVSTGAMLPALGEKDEQAFAVAFSPVDSVLAVRAAYPVGAGLPGTSVWRSTDLTRLWDSDRESEMPTRLAYNAFSPDGALLVSLRPASAMTGAFRVNVRRVSDGATAADLSVVGRPRQAVFSPDGKTLAVAAADGLHLYQTASWTLARDIPGIFLSVGFSPDGRTLIAGSADGAVSFFCP